MFFGVMVKPMPILYCLLPQQNCGKVEDEDFYRFQAALEI